MKPLANVLTKTLAVAALLSAGMTVESSAQEVALKTNILGWATTTINAGSEIGVGRQSTVQIFGALNPWTFSGGKRVRIWAVEPEFRWWPCEKFDGHFFGIHALGGQYNVRNVDLPFGLLPKTENGRHYEGWYIGAGLTYGYQWILSRHWNIEASIGLGYAYSPYKLYGRCDRCLKKNHRNYVGPTKVAISAVYLF